MIQNLNKMTTSRVRTSHDNLNGQGWLNEATTGETEHKISFGEHSNHQEKKRTVTTQKVLWGQKMVRNMV